MGITQNTKWKSLASGILVLATVGLAGCQSETVDKVDATDGFEAAKAYANAICLGDKVGAVYQMSRQYQGFADEPTFDPALERASEECQELGGIEKFELASESNRFIKVAYHFGNGRVSKPQPYTLNKTDGVVKLNKSDPRICHPSRGCF